MSRVKDQYHDEICANAEHWKAEQDDAITALYGPSEYVKAGMDYAMQAGRTAKALEAVIEAQEEFLRLTNGSKTTQSVGKKTKPALAEQGRY